MTVTDDLAGLIWMGLVIATPTPYQHKRSLIVGHSGASVAKSENLNKGRYLSTNEGLKDRRRACCF
jgi:hypothetical protein